MNKIIGKNLSLLRKANNFTQDQVSSFLKIERSAYSNYETGDREAPISVLESLAKLYGCELHLLLEENPEIVKEMLICAFRANDLLASDMEEIAKFKNIVNNYLKMNTLLTE